MLRRAASTTRSSGRTSRLVIVLFTALFTALGVMTFGPADVKRPGVADADVGTTVGSAQYPVPANAIVVSPSGNNAAAGTTAAPYQTLGHAVSAAPSGATIVLRAGTYHESVALNKRVTIQSWPGESVWLDGSVPVKGWAASGGRWHAGWMIELDTSPTYTRGAPDNPGNWAFVNANFPMAAHPDQIWIDGVAQRQVGSLAQVGPGTFFHDRPADQLWLGTDPAGKDVRASDTTRALMIRADGSVVRGLGIRRYSPSVPDMGAVTVERAGVVIENVAITDSATTGLHIGSSFDTSNLVVRNVHVARSGMLGISAVYADHSTFDQVETVNNNTERFNTAPVSGGAKFGRSRGVVVRNSVLSDNWGPGLWFDESVYDMTVTGNDIRNNAKHGISLEISAKANVTNNTIVGNTGYGIKVNNTSNVAIANNTFVGNDRSINIVQDDRRPTEPNASGRDKRQPFPDPTMTWLVGPVSVADNVLSNQRSGNCMLCVEDYTYQRSAEQIGVSANGDDFARPNASSPANLVIWSRGGGNNPAAFADLASFRAATGQEAAGSLIEGTPNPPATTKPPAPTTTTTKPPAPTTTTTKPPAPTTTAPPTTTTPTVPEPEPPTQYASDVFARNVVNGLGTANVGGKWTVSNASSTYWVAGHAGWIRGAVARSRAGHLPSINQRDVDYITDLAIDTPPSGGGAYVSLIARRVSNGTDYRLLLRYMSDGTVVAHLMRYVDGTEKLLAWKTIPDLVVKPGEVLRARLVVSGGSTTTLSATVWRRDSQGPRSWLLTTTDATPRALQAAGDVGFNLYTSQSWTGRPPIIAVDNLVVREP